VHRGLGDQHWSFQRPGSWRLMAQGSCQVHSLRLSSCIETLNKTAVLPFLLSDPLSTCLCVCSTPIAQKRFVLELCLLYRTLTKKVPCRKPNPPTILPDCKNIHISTDILWRVFLNLTKPVLYTFMSINRWNNEARVHIAI